MSPESKNNQDTVRFQRLVALYVCILAISGAGTYLSEATQADLELYARIKDLTNTQVANFILGHLGDFLAPYMVGSIPALFLSMTGLFLSRLGVEESAEEAKIYSHTFYVGSALASLVLLGQEIASIVDTDSIDPNTCHLRNYICYGDTTDLIAFSLPIIISAIYFTRNYFLEDSEEYEDSKNTQSLLQ